MQRVANERPLSVSQWQILRHLQARPWAQQELAVALGRKSQAMAKSLDVLQRRGMVQPVDERGHPGPRTPARRWSLTQLGAMFADGPPPAAPGPDRGRAESAEGSEAEDDEVDPDSRSREPSIFELRRHQGFLVARVSGNGLSALLEALAEGRHAVEAGFVARLDGDSHGYYFFFDSRLGARPAETLAAVLRASGVEVTLGVVADVRSLGEMVRDARAAASAAHSASQRRPDIRPPKE